MHLMANILQVAIFFLLQSSSLESKQISPIILPFKKVKGEQITSASFIVRMFLSKSHKQHIKIPLKMMQENVK